MAYQAGLLFILDTHLSRSFEHRHFDIQDRVL